MSLRLCSPAKVNLFLKVMGKRTDGYHQLATLCQAVGLCDWIEIKYAEKDSFSCDRKEVPTDQSNLILQAVDLFRRKVGVNQPVDIRLEKKIPLQAGLGGGSSNAATALWGLNRLFGFPVETESLKRWSQELGSDVPFFFSEGTAYCTGRGGQVISCPPLFNGTLSLYKPSLGLSTPKVYRALRLSQVSHKDPEKTLRGWLEGTPDYYNDLEPSAFSLLPSLARIKEELQAKMGSPVLMSGSGTTFFCSGDHVASPYFLGVVKGCRREVDGWYEQKEERSDEDLY